MAFNIVRNDPFRDLQRGDPLRSISDMLRDFSLMSPLRQRDGGNGMLIDVSENEQAYTVKAEVPGVSRDDIKVTIDGNVVTISAEVKGEQDNSGDKMVYSERFWGQQYRSFSLPQEVDDGAAQAKYNDGVLELTLPKRAGGGAHQLTIQ